MHTNIKRSIFPVILVLIASWVAQPAYAQAATVNQNDGGCGAAGPVYCDVDQAIDNGITDITIVDNTGAYPGFTVDVAEVTVNGGTGNTINGTVVINNPLGAVNFNATIQNLAISNALGTGIQFSGGNAINSVTLDNLDINLTQTGGLDNGIAFPANAVINDLVISDSTFSGSDQAIVQEQNCALPGSINNMLVIDSTFENFAYKGSSLTRASNIAFVGNTFDGGGLLFNNPSFRPTALEIEANCSPGSNINILGNEFFDGPRPGPGVAPSERSTAIQLTARNGGVLNDVQIEGANIEDYHQGLALATDQSADPVDGSIGEVTVRRSRFVTHDPTAANAAGVNLFGIINASNATVDATNNWWGTNEGPNNNASGPGSNNVSQFGDTIVDPADIGSVNLFGNGATFFEPWLVADLDATIPIDPGQTSDVVASFVSSNGNPVGTNTESSGSTGVTADFFSINIPSFPDGEDFSFSEQTSLGTGTVGVQVPTDDGSAEAVFTSNGTPGTATVLGQIDNQSVGLAGPVSADIVIGGQPLLASNPAPNGTIELGPTGEASLNVGNAGEANSLLDITLVSITDGYTITGLPISGLQPATGVEVLTLNCTVPTADGTLVLQTNETDTPQYTYTLTCDAESVVDGGDDDDDDNDDDDGGEGGDDNDGDGEPVIVAGQPLTTGTAPTLASVTRLPSTGETPSERKWILAGVSLLVIGSVGVAWRRFGLRETT